MAIIETALGSVAVLMLAGFAIATGIVIAKPALATLGLRQFLLIRVATGSVGAVVVWLAAGAPLTLSLSAVPLVAGSLLMCPVLLNVLFLPVWRGAKSVR